MIQYVDVLVTLVAGVLYTIVMILTGASLDEWLLNLIIIMIVAMILGRIFKKYVMKNIFVDKEKKQLKIDDSTKPDENKPNFISEFRDDDDEEYEEDED